MKSGAAGGALGVEEVEGSAEVGGISEARGLEEEVVLGGVEVEGGIGGRAERGTVEEGGDIVGIVREWRERVGREGREAGRAVREEKGVVERERERGDWWGYVFAYVCVFFRPHTHFHFHLSLSLTALCTALSKSQISINPHFHGRGSSTLRTRVSFGLATILFVKFLTTVKLTMVIINNS